MTSFDWRLENFSEHQRIRGLMFFNWQGLLLLLAANRYFFVDATYVFINSCRLHVSYVLRHVLQSKTTNRAFRLSLFMTDIDFQHYFFDPQLDTWSLVDSPCFSMVLPPAPKNYFIHISQTVPFPRRKTTVIG